MAGGGAPGMVYVSNLPNGILEETIAECFGSIGLLKMDPRKGKPKIWLYRDQTSGALKGDATVTYQDPAAAEAAVNWFNNTEFHGNVLSVQLAERHHSQPEAAPPVPLRIVPPDVPGGGPPKPLENRDGDWACPKPGCNNTNFAFRGQCNRCQTPRPGGGGGGGGRGGGRGGRGGDGGGRGGRGGSGSSLFGPDDWNCGMCGNTNWAKRAACNVCNTARPGGAVDRREGLAGGFKEREDDEDLQEKMRRRKEHEENDEDMYDDFGILKKKFRTKKAEADKAKAAAEEEDYYKDEIKKQVARDKELEAERLKNRKNAEHSQAYQTSPERNRYSSGQRRSRSPGRDRYAERDRSRDDYSRGGSGSRRDRDQDYHDNREHRSRDRERDRDHRDSRSYNDRDRRDRDRGQDRY